jgi:hypothetical protein
MASFACDKSSPPGQPKGVSMASWTTIAQYDREVTAKEGK